METVWIRPGGFRTEVLAFVTTGMWGDELCSRVISWGHCVYHRVLAVDRGGVEGLGCTQFVLLLMLALNLGTYNNSSICCASSCLHGDSRGLYKGA